MAETRKILGQRNPSAATLEVLYTVPALTQVVASTIVICNRSTATSYRIAVAVAGAADTEKQYLFYDTAIGDHVTDTVTIGMTFGAADEVRVYATLATLSFNLFGVELTA